MFVLLFIYIENSDMQGNPDASDLVVCTDMSGIDLKPTSDLHITC